MPNPRADDVSIIDRPPIWLPDGGRIDYLKQHDGVRFMTGSEILDWYRTATGA